MRIVGRADVEGAFVGTRGLCTESGDGGGESVELESVGAPTEERVRKCALRGLGREGAVPQPVTWMRLETKLETGMMRLAGAPREGRFECESHLAQ